MKRFIIYVLSYFLCYNGVAQMLTEKEDIKTNHYISGFKYIDWKDVGWGLSEYSYGFLNQGLNTVTGTYSLLKDFYFNKETYRELSGLTWGDIKNADYKELGKSIAEPIIEETINMGKNYLTGSPESSGEAAFKVFDFVSGAKGISKDLVSLRPIDFRNPTQLSRGISNAESLRLTPDTKFGQIKQLTSDVAKGIDKISNYTPSVINNKSDKSEQQAEQGHSIDSMIRTVILFDNTMKVGFYKQINKSGVIYIVLNDIDLYRIDTNFLSEITNKNSNAENFENKDKKMKTRNETIPNQKRDQRGM